MKITPDIIRYEFIGSEGKVTASPHADYIGLNGLVVGETKILLLSSMKVKPRT